MEIKKNDTFDYTCSLLRLTYVVDKCVAVAQKYFHNIKEIELEVDSFDGDKKHVVIRVTVQNGVHAARQLAEDYDKWLDWFIQQETLGSNRFNDVVLTICRRE